MKQKIAPYAMPIAYAITAVIMLIGFIQAVRELDSDEIWNAFWERM